MNVKIIIVVGWFFSLRKRLASHWYQNQTIIWQKGKLQTNITDEYRCKNSQQNTSKPTPTKHCESESVSHSIVSDSLRPHGCSPPGSSVHGNLQARILEWVAITFFRGSNPEIKSRSPSLQADSLLSELTGKPTTKH